MLLQLLLAACCAKKTLPRRRLRGPPHIFAAYATDVDALSQRSDVLSQNRSCRLLSVILTDARRALCATREARSEKTRHWAGLLDSLSDEDDAADELDEFLFFFGFFFFLFFALAFAFASLFALGAGVVVLVLALEAKDEIYCLE